MCLLMFRMWEGEVDEGLEMRYEEENVFTDLELDGDYCCRFRQGPNSCKRHHIHIKKVTFGFIIDIIKALKDWR